MDLTMYVTWFLIQQQSKICLDDVASFEKNCTWGLMTMQLMIISMYSLGLNFAALEAGVNEWETELHNIMCVYLLFEPIQAYGVGLQSLDFWDCEFYPAEGVDVCLLCLLQPLRGADHSFRGVLPRVCDLETSVMQQPWPELGCCATGKE